MTISHHQSSKACICCRIWKSPLLFVSKSFKIIFSVNSLLFSHRHRIWKGTKKNLFFDISVHSSTLFYLFVTKFIESFLAKHLKPEKNEKNLKVVSPEIAFWVLRKDFELLCFLSYWNINSTAKIAFIFRLKFLQSWMKYEWKNFKMIFSVHSWLIFNHENFWP